MSKLRLTPVQDLATHGARAVKAFEIDAEHYLVVPQLARDIPGQAATMTGGDSDVDSPVLRWADGAFVPHQRLPICGGEDAEFFSIDGRHFLATASLRSGSGPYRYDVDSVIFEWQGGRFEPFQQVPTVAAKQWTYFAFDGRHFLALAQGATPPGSPAPPASLSTVFEWLGGRFVPLQTVDSAWGYNWTSFDIGGQQFLAHADHAVPSQVHRWNGDRFEPFQTLDGSSGRAFCVFEAEGSTWLAFANLLGDSLLYRWNGERWLQHQVLSGPGGREFHWLAADGLLLQVNFIRGSREQPVPGLDSVFHAWQGGQLVPAQTLATSGATDCACFSIAGVRYLAVSNSLSADVHFDTMSHIYRVES